MAVKVYQLKDINREVHMVGDYVGVSFYLKHYSRITNTVETKSITETWERDKDLTPYINFYDIRQGSDGEYYKDEDSPVAGSLDVKSAMQIAQELAEAIHYIQSEGWMKA